MTAQELLPNLKGVKKSGAGWTARCPAHDDAHNSLSVSDGDDGRLLLKCHAGCEFQSILAAVPHANGNVSSKREVATYDYRDQDGRQIYQSVRFDPKDFRQRRPDGQGGWIWNLNGGPRVLYRLPELLKAKPSQTVLIVEGEKDADRLAGLGLVAITNSAGAGKWRDEYGEWLRGRKVAILPDNDEPGKAHALQVATSLQGKATSVKIVEMPNLPDKGDVSDWLDAGGNVRGLRDLVNRAAEFATPQSLGQRRQKTDLSNFRFTTLDDLLAEPKEEIASVVERMLPCGGFSMICAKPKVGKSTTARHLAVCVANGDPFFGRATKQGKVIYLCLEEKRAEVADHFLRMGASGPNIIIHTGATPKDVLTALESAIEEYSPALVIIDPLSRFIRADFNDYSDVTRSLEPLIDLARTSKSQAHILSCHHNGKGGDLRDGGDAVLGSTALFEIVDALLTMRKKEKVRTIESTQRYGEDLPETIIRLDPQTGGLESIGDMKTFTLDERKKAIMDAVGSEPMPESAIKEMIGGTSGITSKALRALYDEGALKRGGGGRKGDPFTYRKPDEIEEIYFPPGITDDQIEAISEEALA